MIGVYKITNTVDGKVYIGSTAKSAKYRWSSHRTLLRAGKHYNIHLQRAWDKYGERAFTFEVIDEGITKEEIREKERAWIRKFFGVNCYNATTEAAGRMAKPKPPKIRKPRKSRIWTEEQRAAVTTRYMVQRINQDITVFGNVFLISQLALLARALKGK